MLEYIIDLKQTSEYIAANVWIYLKGQNACKLWSQTLTVQILKALSKNRISWNLSIPNIVNILN